MNKHELNVSEACAKMWLKEPHLACLPLANRWHRIINQAFTDLETACQLCRQLIPAVQRKNAIMHFSVHRQAGRQ